MTSIRKVIFTLTCVLFLMGPGRDASAQKLDYDPKILLVTAHPDDDAIWSPTIFKTTHLLDGIADLAIMTNGEGGYRYSTLGNYIYDKNLDSEETGRRYLPGIRKKEVMAGGDIVGIRNYFFFDQVDEAYTLDIEKPLATWDTGWIVERLTAILKREQYDFVFTMLPEHDSHGHHKASALIALRAVEKLEKNERPVVLGTTIFRSKDDTTSYRQLRDYPLTRVNAEVKPFTFDRTETFGRNNRLNYNIISNWVIAEHKSQGTMQLFMDTVKVEVYLYYNLNDVAGVEKTRAYFEEVDEADLYKLEGQKDR